MQNLNEVIQSVMDDFENVNTKVCDNAQKLWNKLYTANDYVQHYYTFIFNHNSRSFQLGSDVGVHKNFQQLRVGFLIKKLTDMS